MERGEQSVNEDDCGEEKRRGGSKTRTANARKSSSAGKTQH
jgi:hypothetical protein